jgi:ketosteroid isomerase-like protein
MSEENLEVVRRFVAAWSSEDPDSALAFLGHDVIWTPAREDPDPQPHRGRAGVRQFWAQWEDLFDDIRVEAEELIDANERIVSRLHVTGRGKGSGIDVDQRVYQVVELRGKSIVRIDEFYDRAAALEVAGLSESGD